MVQILPPQPLKHSPPIGWAVFLSLSGRIRAHVRRVMRPTSGARWDKRPARRRWRKQGRPLIRSGRKTGGKAEARTVFRITARRREAITRRSLVQILPPQPYRVDVTDFSYIHLFFCARFMPSQSSPTIFSLPSTKKPEMWYPSACLENRIPYSSTLLGSTFFKHGFPYSPSSLPPPNTTSSL